MSFELNVLNVAKCNLGKVNLKAMLVSSFSSHTGGGPMPVAGASRDLYTQLLACSSLQSVVAIACCLCAIKRALHRHIHLVCLLAASHTFDGLHL